MALNLYEYQKEAVRQLKTGAILCGGVGTGKSRTALAYYYERVCKGKIPKGGKSGFELMQNPMPLYIITTARKRDTFEWDREMALFLLSRKDGQVPVVVDSWNNIKKYVDVEDSFFIFDEQRLVGWGAWTKSFLKISKRNKWILLSATPGDQWMDYCGVFVANGFYKNKTEFVRRHVVYDRFASFPKIKKYLDTDILEKHRKAITVTMSGITKATRHHNWIKVGYDEELYKQSLVNRWSVYKNVPIENASELCYELRRITNSDLRRLAALKNVMGNHSKIIVFYNFDYELEALRNFCEKVGIDYAEWNGHLHEPLPTSRRWLYLVQYTAGAEGWNCIETNAIVFFSMNYSYKTTFQASGRIDRLNTPYTDLYYYHFFSDSPIDSAIRKCINKKKTFNESNFARSLKKHGL